MNWINIHTDTLRSESYLGADPIERATWLNLMAWCATQENGGVIQNASSWTDRKWQQLCGITEEEAIIKSDLYYFTDDGEMIVNLYPIEKEKEVIANRENGKKGGRPRKHKEENQVVINGETQNKPSGTKSVKRKGREREGNGKDILSDESDEKENSKNNLLEEIWSMFPPRSRNRSSKKKLESAWKNIRNKPTRNELIENLTSWSKTEQWVNENGQYLEAVDRFIKSEKWRDKPVIEASKQSPKRLFTPV